MTARKRLVQDSTASPAQVYEPESPLAIDGDNDVWLYTSDGPPASTTGVGAGQSDNGYYYGGTAQIWKSSDPVVPAWTEQTTVSVTTGTDAPVDPSNPGDWYIQYGLTGDVLGYNASLWQDDGAGGWGLFAVSDVGNFVIDTHSPVPTNSADALGFGVAGPGSVCIDRSTAGAEGWYRQINTKEAPVWAPLYGSYEQGFRPSTTGPLNPGLQRLVNLTFPNDATYIQVKKSLVNTSTPLSSGNPLLVALPGSIAVRTAALFAHVLPSAAMTAGVRLTWDEIAYLFYADLPVADPDTGVITYTELDDADTILGGGLAQMLVHGGVF